MGAGLAHRLAISAHGIVKGGASPSRRACAKVGESDPAGLLGAGAWRPVMCGCWMAADVLAWRVALYWNREGVSLLGAVGPVTIFWFLRRYRLSVAILMGCW